MADIDTNSLGNEIIKKRLQLEDELVMKQAINLQKASIASGGEVIDLKDAVEQVRADYGPQINYIVSLFVENETNKLKVLDEIIGESAKVNRLASIAQDFSQKIPKENLKELPIPDYSEKPKQPSETSLESFQEKLKSPKYNTDENLTPLLDSPDEDIKKEASEEFIRRNANKGSYSERTKRELDQASADYDRVVEPGASGGPTQTEQEAARKYREKLEEHESAKRAEIKPSREGNVPGGFYEKGPREPAPPTKEEELGPINPDGTKNFIDPNTGKYTKNDPVKTEEANKEWLSKQGYATRADGTYDPKLLRDAQWAQEDQAQREKDREERYRDRIRNQEEKNADRVAAGKKPIDYGNTGSKTDDKKYGKGEMESFGLYGADGRKIKSGIPKSSNRDVAASAAKLIRGNQGLKNTARGAGNLVIGAGAGLQGAGSSLSNLGQKLEQSGQTADGTQKSGLGNAAKRFLGKDIAKTGENLGAAGEKLKAVGDKIKQQAVRAIVRAVIWAMPAIAAALAFLLVFTMVLAILILIFCKAMENPAAEVVARFAGVPEEFKKICKDAGFSTPSCNTSTSGTIGGTPCTNESIVIDGLQMPDVAWLPDNENLYIFMLATRAQEVGGLNWSNTTAGDSDRDSCGPYQQRINEIFPGGGKANAAKQIMGEAKYNQVFKGAPSPSESYGEDPVTKAEALSYCKLLIAGTGPAFFDQLFVQRIKDQGQYDKVLAGGDPSIYPKLVYDVQIGEPKNEKIINTVRAAKEQKLFDQKKKKCGLGPTDVPTTDPTVRPALDFNQNFNTLSRILGGVEVEAQSTSGISAQRKQLADLMRSGKISAQSGDDISNVESGVYADNLVLMMLKLYNSGMTFRTGSDNYRPPAGRSQHTRGEAMDFVAFQKGDTFNDAQAKYVDQVNNDSSALSVVTEAVNIMKASGAVAGNQLIGPDSMKAKGLVPMGTSDVVDGEGNVIGTHEDHIHVGVNPSAKVDTTGVDGISPTNSNGGSSSDPCPTSDTSSSQTTEYKGDAKVDKGFVDFMKAASKGQFADSMCYQAVWFGGLAPNYNKNPDSPWGKVFPALDQAANESGYSHLSAIHFALTLNKPGVADKVGVRNLKNEGIGDPNDSRVPPGAIIVVSNEYPGVSAIHGDINVKSDDGRYLNFGDMTSWMKTIEPKYILGIYVPK
jgi:hypothetical protein